LEANDDVIEDEDADNLIN